MLDALTIDFDKPIPLFPLPNCVLLPHATIPLHIFEERYRKLVSNALDGRGLIAMALFEGDAWRSDYEGRPPLRPHVCVGYIHKHVRMDDGRYHLLLQGLRRARIDREINTDVLIDLAAMTCTANAEERYTALAEPDIFARAAWLENLLRHIRTTMHQAEQHKPADSADHTHVN